MYLVPMVDLVPTTCAWAIHCMCEKRMVKSGLVMKQCVV